MLIAGEDDRARACPSAKLSHFKRKRTQMTKLVGRFAGIGIAVLAGTALYVAAQTTAPAQIPAAAKTAEQHFKNIQVLKEIPAEQLIPTMQFISNSLGVECDFCHVEHHFDQDDKEEKRTARKMMLMQMTINKEGFGGKREVTCNTCHRGSEHPMAIPAIMQTDTPMRAEAEEHENPATPPASPDAVIEQYIQALGGKTAIDKITSRVQKGTMSVGGHEMPIAVYSQAPDMRVSISTTPMGESVTAFNGKEGWLVAGNRPPREMAGAELEAARMDADLHFATNLKSLFTNFRPGRPDKIDGKDVNVVMAMREGQPPVRLFFDKQTGLLVRLVRYAETALGRNPTQIDYADYRDNGGVRVPYRWTIARPNGRFTIQVAEMQQNVPIDASRFVKPAGAAAPAPAESGQTGGGGHPGMTTAAPSIKP
jgi:photosynthetic reaction center cytochrome c subunit